MASISFDYGGHVALVTGAARGLGFAIAKALHDAGATVAVNDRTAENCAAAIARLGGGVRLIAAPADLALPTGPAQAVAACGQQLDFLINNAAVNVEKPVAETDDAHWDTHLNVNLRAPFLATQAALPLLKASKGCIVNIASELGLHAIANNVAYVSAKHGLVTMTKAMAIELARFGIRANALCPGTMDTELMRDCAADSGDPAAYYAAFDRYHPIGRLASPSEIAGFVLTLLSPAAGFMTGSAIAIDGGSSAGRT
ncbi:MAG TPA: SDR family oxidoreductase [Dongiaceae bacterium]|nr:SDR family oxidoreductase [Dongiaceae bacterium]